MSALRARCPHCRTLTAVAVDDGYECHSCGARVRGRARPRPARLGRRAARRWPRRRASTLPYPEAAVVERGHARRAERRDRRGAAASARSCSAAAAARTSARSAGSPARYDRLAVVWLDAHGDLNTPETSPSGNLWGMPFRMLLDDGQRATRRTSRSSARATSTRPRSSSSRRARDRRRRSTRALDGVSTPSTSRSTSTCSIRATMPCFMPEPGRPRRSTRSRRCSATSPAGRRSRGSGSPGSRRPDARSRRRSARLAGRGRALSGPALRCPGMSASRVDVDVSIEHKRADPRDATATRPPEHVPRLRLALPRRRARASTCASARSAATTSRCARASGSSSSPTRASFDEEDARPALGRPARVLRPPAVHRAARGGRGGDRPRRRDRLRAAPRSSGQPCELAVMDFVVHGRLDGQRRRREVRARLRARRRGAACRSSRSRPRAAPACRRGSSR